jgi:hypothetical protein
MKNVGNPGQESVYTVDKQMKVEFYQYQYQYQYQYKFDKQSIFYIQ